MQASSALPGKPINTNVSFFDAGMPGSLPVLNDNALKQAVKAGLALGATIPNFSYFDRKHYFYPDLPAGYQITQYHEPIARNGKVVLDEIDGFSQPISVGISQIQLEMDSGKRVAGSDATDLNRAGVAVLEIVSEPQLTSFEEAIAFIKKVQRILSYQEIIDTSEHDEAGVRSDFNISVSLDNQSLGTRTELKHVAKLNSLRDCLNYEIHRQISLMEEGHPVMFETRGIDFENGTTFTLREKEASKDYRFMPEPDIPPLNLTRVRIWDPERKQFIESMETDLHESLDLITSRLLNKYKLPLTTVKSIMTEPYAAEYFEKVVENRNPEIVANWIIGEVFRQLHSNNLSMRQFNVNPLYFGHLIDMIEKRDISKLYGKKILVQLMSGIQNPPFEIARSLGWLQINDDSVVLEFCKRALQANPEIINNYNHSLKQVQKDKCIKALIGKVMMISKGKLDPKLIHKMLFKLLE